MLPFLTFREKLARIGRITLSSKNTIASVYPPHEAYKHLEIARIYISSFLNT